MFSTFSTLSTPDFSFGLKTEERTPCEVWTRVVGYHRPVSEFNLGKQAEHRERVHFQVCDQIQ